MLFGYIVEFDVVWLYCEIVDWFGWLLDYWRSL